MPRQADADPTSPPQSNPESGALASCWSDNQAVKFIPAGEFGGNSAPGRASLVFFNRPIDASGGGAGTGNKTAAECAAWVAKGAEGAQDGYDFFVEAMPNAAGQGLCMSSDAEEVGPFYTVYVRTEEFEAFQPATTTRAAAAAAAAAAATTTTTTTTTTTSTAVPAVTAAWATTMAAATTTATPATTTAAAAATTTIPNTESLAALNATLTPAGATKSMMTTTTTTSPAALEAFTTIKTLVPTIAKQGNAAVRELQSFVDKQINATINADASGATAPPPALYATGVAQSGDELLGLAESLLPQLTLAELLQIRKDLDNVLIASLSLGGGGSGGSGSGNATSNNATTEAAAAAAAREIPTVNASAAAVGSAGGIQTQAENETKA